MISDATASADLKSSRHDQVTGRSKRRWAVSLAHHVDACDGLHDDVASEDALVDSQLDTGRQLLAVLGVSCEDIVGLFA